MDRNKYFNIFEELQKWSKNLDNWERLALLYTIQKGFISEEDIQAIYNEFKLDKELIQSVDRKSYSLEGSFVPHATNQIKLPVISKLQDVKGVNAIAEGQILDFGPKLTVIYGPNGSGKSGYARILKSACFTRSPDKTIYGNVHSGIEEQENPSAVFVFEDGSSILFKQGVPCSQLRDNFAVFDNSCVRVCIDAKTDFNVQPYGFDVFPGLVNIFDKIRELLKFEIKSYKPDLDSFKILESSSIIADLLNNLNTGTDLQKLEELKDFNELDEMRIIAIEKELEDLLKKDPIELIRQKRCCGKDIKYVIKKILELNNKIKKDIVTEIKNKIISIKELKKISEVSSISQFKDEAVQPIGTILWRKLIESAIAYNQEAYPEANFPAEIKDSKCLLCHQLLGSDAKERLRCFFEFISSDTEKKVQKLSTELEDLKKILEEIDLDFISDKTLVYQTITVYDANMAKDTKRHVNVIEIELKKLINNIETQEWEKVIFKIISVDNLCDSRNKLAQDIKTLRLKDVSKYKIKLLTELQLLHDKKYLNKIFTEVKKAIIHLKWIEKAKGVLKLLNHRHITDKQKALINKLVAQGFTERFIKECKNLDFKLPIKIKITGTDAVTYRNLTMGVNNLQIPDPSQILSEGEQTAVALSDFLTEIALSKQVLGIVFDDPVSSLDHLRKEIIAKRLVEEATRRQVIVFTHDILFTHHLAEYSQKIGSKKVKFKACTVSVNSDNKTPGYVNKIVFPHEYYEKESVKHAKECLEQARKLSGQEQKEKLELGCGILRVAYENFIQRRLFNDVVVRWREHIKATALSRIYYNEEIIKDVVENYELLSRYINAHSHSSQFSEKLLTCDLLGEKIIIFEKINSRYNKEYEKFRKEKSREKRDVFLEDT